MYYDSKEIDEDLKCSVCKQKFSGDVRLVPDCGESVCECCYEELKDSVDRSSRFKCRACKSSHAMPQSGLPVNKGLSKIVKRRKVEKSLSDEAKTLKCAVESLKSQLKELESFDETDHINQHCDKLEIEVMEEISSFVKELNEIETDLLKQISEYRKSCLDAWSERRAREDGVDEFKQELDALRKDTTEFGAKWTDQLARIDALDSKKEIKKALDKTRRFEKKMRNLHVRIKSRALNCETMTLTTNHSFFDDQSPLRRAIRLTIQDDRYRELKIESTPSHTLEGHSDQINQVVFLEDGNLASCADDKSIRIWDVVSGSMLFKLEGHEHNVNCLASIRNGWLASGSTDTTIKIWDLVARREIRTLEGHAQLVVSLETLSNGILVSFSHDDTIKIWNPHAATNQLLLTIDGQDFSKCMVRVPYGVLSNDNLITLKRTNAKTTIKVWNHTDGKLIKSTPTGLPSVSVMLVLRNDQIALMSNDETIKIVGLDDDETALITIDNLGVGLVLALAQLPNSDLISWSVSEHVDEYEYFIRVWSLKNGSLLQTLETDSANDLSSMAISPDGTLFATGSYNDTITLWPIKPLMLLAEIKQ